MTKRAPTNFQEYLAHVRDIAEARAAPMRVRHAANLKMIAAKSKNERTVTANGKMRRRRSRTV